MADVFLSYARPDRAKASTLADYLAARGLSVWYDKSLTPGTAFPTQIEEQLNAARFVVVLWSKASVRSTWVRDEAQYGLTSGKLVPALIETCEQPLGMRSLHAIDLTDWHAGCEALTAHLSSQSDTRNLGIVSDHLRTEIVRVFRSDSYRGRRSEIDRAFRDGQEREFDALSERAKTLDIAIIRTPSGYAMAPLHDGKVIKPEVFNALPEEMRKEVESRIEGLQKQLEALLERVPDRDRERKKEIERLDISYLNDIVQSARSGTLAAMELPGERVFELARQMLYDPATFEVPTAPTVPDLDGPGLAPLAQKAGSGSGAHRTSVIGADRAISIAALGPGELAVLYESGEIWVINSKTGARLRALSTGATPIPGIHPVKS